MTGYKPFFPDQAYPLLYADVMKHKLFPDSKTFADAVPRVSPEQISTLYLQVHRDHSEEIKKFVLKWFDFPIESVPLSFHEHSIIPHLHQLWDHLLRLPDPVYPYSSLIPLPHSYVVPGGRFREIYYWDSYFTMLGLHVSDRPEIIHDMVSNFSWILGQTGQIPNGNRSYFLSRSQPPFFSLMVELLAQIEGNHIYTDHLTDLLIEHAFWNNESEDTQSKDGRLLDINGFKMYRYYDALDTPRAESFAEDVRLRGHAYENEGLFRDLRAACESGWDFSGRWLKDEMNLKSIHTTDIIPADLNSLIYLLQQNIALAHDLNNNDYEKLKFENLAQQRIDSMNDFLWNEDEGYFGDRDYKSGQFKSPSLAIMYPLFAGIATTKQAERTIAFLQAHFLRPGGWVTSLKKTGQQWDAPNGWAPLQWITFVGLQNYGAHELAHEGAKRWLSLNEEVFRRTGRMMEKYNVEDLTLEAGGGEYKVQDGFGWTNGVYLAIAKELDLI